MKKLLIPLVVLAALGGAAIAYMQNRQPVGPLTGNSVSGNIANRRAIGVTYDNYSPDAKPQSGLDRASLVFETLAEGGITRFLAIFDEQDASVVGPVRSTRFYFNSWAAAEGIIFGHDGGNVDALQQLPHLSSIYNIDADRTPGPFYRTTDRAVPHNEYTSTTSLRTFAENHGGSITGSPPSIPHKDDAPLNQRPAHFTLDVQLSYGDYNVEWRYDPRANDYLRFQGGSPDVDAVTKQQLTAKNVVVMMTDEIPATDPFTPNAIHMRTEGTGPATAYRDGVAVQGTWNKSTVDGPLQWVDGNGHSISLDRGNTWVEVVPKGNSVTSR